MKLEQVHVKTKLNETEREREERSPHPIMTIHVHFESFILSTMSRFMLLLIFSLIIAIMIIMQAYRIYFENFS